MGSRLFPDLGMAAWRSPVSRRCLFRQSGGRWISVVVGQVRGCNVVTLHDGATDPRGNIMFYQLVSGLGTPGCR
jgi:hypothetical protein